MSVTIDNLERLDAYGRSYRLSWSSSLGAGTTCYVYRDGRLVTTTTATSYEFTVGPGESPLFDVVDALADAPERFPNRLLLTWYEPTEGAASYRVEEFVDAAWTVRATLAGDEASGGYFRWESRILEDATTHQFRVLAVGANGNDSTATALTCLMVRVPDAPPGSFSYDPDDGTVTIDSL